ncbi:MAG: EAL domain-containing protein [Pseudazoarcus pumilus]|nr:EAL domain-containing protein [Pseudazoarcus pumilus]
MKQNCASEAARHLETAPHVELDEAMRLARFTVEHASDAVYWIRSDATLFYANQAACRALGYGQQDIIGLTVADIDPHYTQDLWAPHWEALRKAGSLTFETEHRSRDGRLIPVEVSANYMVLQDRAFNCAFVRDITERKRAQAELHASGQRFANLVNAVEGVVWEADAATTNFTYVSEQAVRLFGYPVKRWYEPGFWASRIHPDDRAWAVNFCLERSRLLETHAFDYRFQRADGRYIWLHDVVSVVADEQGLPTLLRGILVDVTASHEARERLRLLAGVFEHAHEGILITDTSPRILDVNPAFSAITGYARNEVIGQDPAMLAPASDSDELITRVAHSADEVWRGEVWSRRRNGEIYPQMRSVSAVRGPDGEVSHYVTVFSDISEIKAQQKRLEKLAHYDALTHLPNRVLLADRLQRAVSRAEKGGNLLAVCYMDLDGFKPVNDLYGHAAGDRLLVELGHRLRSALRDSDTVARLGGDEFAVLLGDLESEEACEHALRRLLETVAQPFHVSGGNTVTLSASIGVTLYPHDQSDPDALLRHADQALYVAKQQGRNRFHVFDFEHDRRARAHQETLLGIERGLEAGEFEMFYQPRVNMRSGRVCGVEALIRWNHPERGLLLPSAFLPVIEDTALESQLGEWVLHNVLTQAEIWWCTGLHLEVSINISVGHLTRSGFADDLFAVLRAHPNLMPSAIELEVLETAALDDMTHVSSLIRECQELGVRFSLDDFGVGYSSLTYLRRLPAETLKIDQSFVRDLLGDPGDLAIVDGVIGLTRAFDRNVVAEGVEASEHGVVLLQLGAEIAQGYGIARPMPAAAVPDWVAAWRPDPLWEKWGSIDWPREHLRLLVAAMQLHQATRGAGAPREEVPCDFDAWCTLHGLERYCSEPRFAQVAAAHAALCALLHEPSGPGQRGRVEQLCDDILEHMAALARAPRTTRQP